MQAYCAKFSLGFGHGWVSALAALTSWVSKHVYGFGILLWLSRVAALIASPDGLTTKTQLWLTKVGGGQLYQAALGARPPEINSSAAVGAKTKETVVVPTTSSARVQADVRTSGPPGESASPIEPSPIFAESKSWWNPPLELVDSAPNLEPARNGNPSTAEGRSAARWP